MENLKLTRDGAMFYIISQGLAESLWNSSDCPTIYKLYDDDTEAEVEGITDLRSHKGEFGLDIGNIKDAVKECNWKRGINDKTDEFAFVVCVNGKPYKTFVWHLSHQNLSDVMMHILLTAQIFRKTASVLVYIGEGDSFNLFESIGWNFERWYAPKQSFPRNAWYDW